MHKLMLSRSASGVETLQRAPALSRNCSALGSGHLKAEVLPSHRRGYGHALRGEGAANPTSTALIVLKFFDTLLLELR